MSEIEHTSRMNAIKGLLSLRPVKHEAHTTVQTIGQAYVAPLIISLRSKQFHKAIAKRSNTKKHIRPHFRPQVLS